MPGLSRPSGGVSVFIGFRAAKAACGLALALLTAACGMPMSTTARFAADSPSVLLVLAQPPYNNGLGTEFRRVSLETNQWEAGRLSYLVTGEMERVVTGPNERTWLRFKSVPPGDYAVTELWASLSRPGDIVSQCLGLAGAPVFRLKPGQIAILRADALLRETSLGVVASIPTDEVVLAQFERARAQYPDIHGEAVVVSPVATVRWPASSTRDCGPFDGFERVDPPVR